MIEGKSFFLGLELLQIMVPGLPQRDIHLIGMNIPLMDLAILICQEVQHVLRQGEIISTMVMVKDLKGHLQVTVKDELVIMTLFLDRSVPMVHWLACFSTS